MSTWLYSGLLTALQIPLNKPTLKTSDARFTVADKQRHLQTALTERYYTIEDFPKH